MNLEDNKKIIAVDQLENRYVTDGNIWTVDTTIFNDNTHLFMVVNLKTRTIVGYILNNESVNDDYVIELYEKICAKYESNQGNPIIIHSDAEPAFSSEKIIKFLKPKNITISTTAGKTKRNQVSESTNHQVKSLVALELLREDTSALKNWRKLLPPKYKALSRKRRAQTKGFRDLLFKSDLFLNRRYESIIKAIYTFNQKEFSDGITLEQAEYYNTKLKGKLLNDTQIVASNNLLARKVEKENQTSIESVKSEIKNILKSDCQIEGKLTKIGLLTLQGQSHTNDLLKQGFGGLALQNAQLLEQNGNLKNDLETIQQNMQTLMQKLEEMNKEKMSIEQAKLRRKNRKRLPKRDPITKEIFGILINEFGTGNYKNAYTRSRTKIALTLLLITGVRISELLPLKAHQIATLFTHNQIAIDRAKRGPASHKAFVSPEGRILLKNVRKDFEILLFNKNNESFIFTPQYSNKPLKREAFTREINGFIRNASKKMDKEPVLTSHSFRIGYISQLWRDEKDIEFVRQVIGHAKIDTTSKYVDELSDEEKQQRIDKIKIPEDLILDTVTT